MSPEPKAKVIIDTDALTIKDVIMQNVEVGSTLHTDKSGAYSHVSGPFFERATVNHSQKDFALDDITTNGIEKLCML